MVENQVVELHQLVSDAELNTDIIQDKVDLKLPSKREPTTIELTRESPLEAAKRLNQMYSNVTCFYLGNATTPKCAEEWSYEKSFMACTGIFACLCASQTYFDHNNRHVNQGFFSNDHILAKKVPVFREDCNLRLQASPICINFLRTALPINKQSDEDKLKK